MAEGKMVFENSWHLSENFERNCIEKCQLSIEQQLEFSLDMKSDREEGDRDCHACKNKEARHKSGRLPVFIGVEASTITDNQNQYDTSSILCDQRNN